ncbi:MAG: glycosyltransferase family 2 protein [Chloroflexota bacterium]
MNRISIVMPTYNRCAVVLRSLHYLHSLEADYPIIVVNNASTDETSAAIRRYYPRVELVELDQNIGAVARNNGAARVQTPYVAFTDDDAWWARGALSRAADYFDLHPGLGLVQARILVNHEERLDPTCAVMAHTPLPRPEGIPGYPILGFVAATIAVRLSAFQEAGGFDAYMGTGGEEALLAIDLARNGWHLAYLPDVVSHHYPSDVRDRAYRETEGARNAIWTAWLRRSWRHALKVTGEVTQRSLRDPNMFRALIEALGGLPRVLSRRRQVSADLEAQLSRLETMHSS